MMNKKIIILVLCLAVMTVLSGCWRKEEKKPIIDDNIKQEIEDQKNEKIDSKDDNEILKLIGKDDNGWNIYQSKKYRFEFKTLENWEIERHGEDKNYGVYISFDNVNTELNHDGFTIYIKSNEKGVTNNNFFKEYQDYEDVTSFEFNKNVITRLLKKTGVGGMVSIFYYIINDNYIYSFSIDNLDEIKKGWQDWPNNNIKSDKVRDKDLNNIVKTFKIIK